MLGGCDQGGEYRPRFYERPSRELTTGPFHEAWYHRSSTHSRRSYAMVTVDGQPVRFEGSHVQRSTYCEVDGIDAVGLQVRGDNPGYYVVQVVDGEAVTTRVCDYNPAPARWDGARYQPVCHVHWDAVAQHAIPWNATHAD